MNPTIEQRIRRVAGRDGFAIGVAVGKDLGGRLQSNVDRYLRERTDADPDTLSFGSEAMAWVESLPLRFKSEIRGLAEGSGTSLERIAEWAYVEVYLQKAGCSSFLRRQDGRVWLGRKRRCVLDHLRTKKFEHFELFLVPGPFSPSR